MKSNILHLTWAGVLAAAPWMTADDREGISLSPIGSYTSGIFDGGAAEIVAHDPGTQRLFVVNARTAGLDVLSIARLGSPGSPKPPVKVGEIDLTPYGAVANSVAVHKGLIAVAVEAAVKTDPGKVVFFDRSLKFLSAVTVGALPDMVTFSPNGRHVLVANEGEPSSDYTVDPEGTVSIIDLAGRGTDEDRVKSAARSKVRSVDFRRFNNATLDPSIRIFGPGQPPAARASVAADLEPEYITVSHDSRTAWVTCQENNALAVIDIPSGTVTRLVGLGFKDHAAVQASTVAYDFDQALMPSIGTTAGGQELKLGGFSGLAFEGVDPVTGRYKFVTHTDRGPNAEPTGALRPFLLPGFAPEVVRFELDRATGALALTQRIALQRAPGSPLTGLSNTAITGGTASTPYNDESPVDLKGNALTPDPLGADLEGIVFQDDGSFWMCDEYRPALYHFDANGVLIRRVVPLGTAAAAGQPTGTFGEEHLPATLAQRRQNRGFEGLALDAGRLYAFVQSPLRNPATAGNAALNANRSIRIVEFNPADNKTRQFLYVMDNPDLGGEGNTRADKIGDAAALGDGTFLVIERDDDKVPSDDPSRIEKKVYQFSLAGATPLTAAMDGGLIGTTGKYVDQLTEAELAAAGINPVAKQLYVDLNAAGYNTSEKAEGLAVIDPWTIAVINDNDFQVAAITVDQTSGTFTLAPGYLPEPVRLGLVTVRHNALDASDRDGAIAIRPWPVKGIYMPDAIASYRVGGRTYLVTANEGDAREYIATNPATGAGVNVFVEAVRVGSGSVVLDPAFFPNASALKNNANLGRLNITATLGKNASGQHEALYAFGTRSFSIWDEKGAQVFDSGDDLEQITAQAFPDSFNTSNTSNTFDNRSDDKGPEPEGVVVGRISGRDYAFIGLERIGGVVVYDISKPRAPFFVGYVNNRDFAQQPETAEGDSNPAAGDLGPEGLLFISAEDSPNGWPLLVVGNEISGTTTVWAIRKADD